MLWTDWIAHLSTPTYKSRRKNLKKSEKQEANPSEVDTGSVLGQVNKSAKSVAKEVQPLPEKKSTHPAKTGRNFPPKPAVPSVKIYKAFTRIGQRDIEESTINRISINRLAYFLASEDLTVQAATDQYSYL